MSIDLNNDQTPKSSSKGRNAATGLRRVALGAAGIAVVVLVSLHFIEKPLASGPSCANHAIQLQGIVETFSEGNPRFPSSGNALDAFVEMARASGWSDAPRDVKHCACPDFVAKDELGYVYVASGLSTRLVQRHQALVFFCPVDHYEGRHYHALRGAEYSQLCVDGRSAMIEILDRALKQAEAGTVPYTPVAVFAIREQLQLLSQEAGS